MEKQQISQKQTPKPNTKVLPMSSVSEVKPQRWSVELALGLGRVLASLGSWSWYNHRAGDAGL